MTEVPEHLLQRSRERRAALGLGGDQPAAEDASAAPAPAGGGESPPAAPPPTAPAPAPEPEPEPEPEPIPPYVAAAMTRKKIPLWAFPVLALLPLWAYIYAATLAEPDEGAEGQLALGEQLYVADAGPACAACHGATGGGGAGRQLSDGEVIATFPQIEQMLEFVAVGSDGFMGEPLGDPDRPGGAHIGGDFGNMPGFSHLTGEELLAVVRHEREVFGGEEIAENLIGPDGELLHENGEPWINEAGELVDAEGNPLLEEDGFLANPGVGPGEGAPVEVDEP